MAGRAGHAVVLEQAAEVGGRYSPLPLVDKLPGLRQLPGEALHREGALGRAGDAGLLERQGVEEGLAAHGKDGAAEGVLRAPVVRGQHEAAVPTAAEIVEPLPVVDEHPELGGGGAAGDNRPPDEGEPRPRVGAVAEAVGVDDRLGEPPLRRLVAEDAIDDGADGVLAHAAAPRPPLGPALVVAVVHVPPADGEAAEVARRLLDVLARDLEAALPHQRERGEARDADVVDEAADGVVGVLDAVAPRAAVVVGGEDDVAALPQMAQHVGVAGQQVVLREEERFVRPSPHPGAAGDDGALLEVAARVRDEPVGQPPRGVEVARVAARQEQEAVGGRPHVEAVVARGHEGAVGQLRVRQPLARTFEDLPRLCAVLRPRLGVGPHDGQLDGDLLLLAAAPHGEDKPTSFGLGLALGDAVAQDAAGVFVLGEAPAVDGEDALVDAHHAVSRAAAVDRRDDECLVEEPADDARRPEVEGELGLAARPDRRPLPDVLVGLLAAGRAGERQREYRSR